MTRLTPPFPSTRPHAVILVAGLGSRLKENTRATPKCLVPVAGRPILERMLDDLAASGIRYVTLAVGYLDDAIREFVAQWLGQNWHKMEVDFVSNDRYAESGSVLSLQIALRATHAWSDQRDMLLVEGDVVLDRALLQRLLETNFDDAATLLAPYEPALNGTFATVADGRVTAWLHESVRNADFELHGSFKTVNLTLVKSGDARARLLAAVEAVIDKNGVKAPLEYAMQRLVCGGMRIAVVGTAGKSWFEVDTAQDLEIANAMFAPLAVPI